MIQQGQRWIAPGDTPQIGCGARRKFTDPRNVLSRRRSKDFAEIEYNRTLPSPSRVVPSIPGMPARRPSGGFSMTSMRRPAVDSRPPSWPATATISTFARFGGAGLVSQGLAQVDDRQRAVAKDHGAGGADGRNRAASDANGLDDGPRGTPKTRRRPPP